MCRPNKSLNYILRQPPEVTEKQENKKKEQIERGVDPQAPGGPGSSNYFGWAQFMGNL